MKRDKKQAVFMFEKYFETAVKFLFAFAVFILCLTGQACVIVFEHRTFKLKQNK